MSFIAALGAKDVVAQYVAAYRAIDGYTRGIENTGPLNDAHNYPNWQNAQTALSQGKQAALSWANGVAARAKEVPASITNWDPELAALIADLKTQAKPPLTDAAKRAIAVDASNIVQILGQKTEEFAGLVKGLSTLAGDLSTASGNILDCQHAIEKDIGGYHSAQGQLIGELQAEASKVCPDKSTIAKLRQQIQQQMAYAGAAGDWESTLSTVCALTKEAVPSARFLQSFWQGIGKGIQQASDAAKKLPQDTAAVLSLDLQQIQDAWTGVEQEMQKITKQLA